MTTNTISAEFNAFLTKHFNNKKSFLHNWLDNWRYTWIDQENWYNSHISKNSIFLHENKLDDILTVIENDQQKANTKKQKQQARQNGKDYLFFLLHLYIASAKSNNRELQQKVETTLRKLVHLFPRDLKHLVVADVNDKTITKKYQNNGISYAFARPLLRNTLSHTEFDELITQYNNLFFKHLMQANKDRKLINISQWVILLNDLKNLQAEIADANPENENNSITKARVNALINTCCKAIPDISKKLGINKVPDFLEIDFNINWGDVVKEPQSNQINLSQVEANKDILAKHAESFINIKKELIDKLVSISNNESQESLVNINDQISKNALVLNTINNSNDWLMSHSTKLNEIENFKNSLIQQHAFFIATSDKLNLALLALQQNYEIEKLKIDDYRNNFTNLTVDDDKISAKEKELDNTYQILHFNLEEKIIAIHTAIKTISDQLAALPTIQKLKKIVIDTINVEQEVLIEKKSKIQYKNELQEALNFELLDPTIPTNELLSAINIHYEQIEKNINTSYANYVTLQKAAIKTTVGLNPDYKVSLNSINAELKKCSEFLGKIDQSNNFSSYNEQIEQIYRSIHIDLDNFLTQLADEEEKLKNNLSNLSITWDEVHNKINNIINSSNTSDEEKIALYKKQDNLEQNYQKLISEISKQQQKVSTLKTSVESTKKVLPGQELFKKQVKNHIQNQIISLSEARNNLLLKKDQFNDLRKSVAGNIGILKSKVVPNEIIDIQDNLENKIDSIKNSMKRLETLSFKGIISKETNDHFKSLTKKIVNSNKKITPIINQMNDLRKKIEDERNKNFEQNIPLTNLEVFSAPDSPSRERLLADLSIEQMNETSNEYEKYNKQIILRNENIMQWENDYKKLETNYNKLLLENKDNYSQLAIIQNNLEREIEKIKKLNQQVTDVRLKFNTEEKSIANSFRQLDNKKEETKEALITLTKSKNKFIANIKTDKYKITNENSDLPVDLQTKGMAALNKMEESANNIVKGAIDKTNTDINSELEIREKIKLEQANRINKVNSIPLTFEEYCKKNNYTSCDKYDEYIVDYQQQLNEVANNFSDEKIKDRKELIAQNLDKHTKSFNKLITACTKANAEFTNNENKPGFQNKQKQIMDNLRKESQQLDKTTKSGFRGLLGSIGGALGGMIAGFIVGGPVGAVVGGVIGAGIGGSAGFGMSYAFSKPSASSFAITSLQPVTVAGNIIDEGEEEINFMFNQQQANKKELSVSDNIIESDNDIIQDNLDSFLSKNNNSDDQLRKASSNFKAGLYQPVNKKPISEKELTAANFDDFIFNSDDSKKTSKLVK